MSKLEETAPNIALVRTADVKGPQQSWLGWLGPGTGFGLEEEQRSDAGTLDKVMLDV